MRASKWLTRLSVLGWLGLVQCNAPQPVPIHSAFDGVPSALRIDPQFRDGLGHLTSTRAWPLASSANDFDWVLMGVKVQWEGAERVWFVRVAEVLDPEEADGGRVLSDRRFEYTVPFGVGAIRPNTKFTVGCRRIRIEAYDARGEFMSAWSRLAPDVFPGSSLYQALATLPQRGPLGVAMVRSDDQIAAESRIEESRRMRDRGLYEMVATLQALGTTAPIAPIREVVKDHVVAMPSILTLVLAGLKPTVTASMKTASACEFPWVLDRVRLPCYQAEFATYLAGERLFNCRVIAGPSAPPMDLLGGLVVLEAAHPDQPENRLTMRVLASSRTRPCDPVGDDGNAIIAKR